MVAKTDCSLAEKQCKKGNQRLRLNDVLNHNSPQRHCQNGGSFERGLQKVVTEDNGDVTNRTITGIVIVFHDRQ